VSSKRCACKRAANAPAIRAVLCPLGNACACTHNLHPKHQHTRCIESSHLTGIVECGLVYNPVGAPCNLQRVRAVARVSQMQQRAAGPSCIQHMFKLLQKITAGRRRERTSDGCTTRPPASVTELPAFNSPSIFPLGMPRRATVSIFILQQPVTPCNTSNTHKNCNNTAASYLPGLSGSVRA